MASFIVLRKQSFVLNIVSYQVGSVEDLVVYSNKWSHLQRTRTNMAWHWAMFINYKLNTEGENSLRILYLLAKHFPERVVPKVLDLAAERGSLDLLKFLTPLFRCTMSAMDYAATEGHLDVVRYLHENRSEGCSTRAMNNAASRGHLSIVKYLHENRSEGCTTEAMDNASGNGHAEIVTFLHYNRLEGCTSQALELAAKNGHLDIVEFLLGNRHEGCIKEALQFATLYKREDIVALFKSHCLLECSTPLSKNRHAKKAVFQVANAAPITVLLSSVLVD